MKYPTPNKPGHFWAKWQIASEATKDGDELTPSPNFEVVQVVENSTDGNDPEHLLVYVPGVEVCQALDAFFWGAEVLPPLAPNREEPGTGARSARVITAKSGRSLAEETDMTELVVDRETLHALARRTAPNGLQGDAYVSPHKVADLAAELADATAVRGEVTIRVVD